MTIEQTNDESGAAPVVLRAWGVGGGDCECCNRRNCLAARVRDAFLKGGWLRLWMNEQCYFSVDVDVYGL
jgi:hypothetical protein